MHLQIVKSEPPESALDELPETTQDTPGRLLVAHAGKSERADLRDLLATEGHQVVLAADSAHALSLLEESAPDVAILDVALPEPDGVEICRRIKGTPHLASIPVLLVRKSTRLSERIAGIEAGADDFLRLPGHERTTLLRVRNAVRVKRLHDQAAHDIRRLKDAERMRDDLTAMIIHDLRGPLTGIRGYAELLKTLVGDRPTAARYVHRIEGGAQCLGGMVDDLLDVGRLEAGKMPLVPSHVTLASLAVEAVDLLGHAQGEGRVTVLAPADAPPITCDANLVRRVLQNLIGNALKFSTPHRPVHVFVSGNDTTSRVEVRDRGPGVPDHLRDHIFEKFAQGDLRRELRAQSTGLGLTFCKLAVEAHKGRIGVTSLEGFGSTFWFELPSKPLVRWSPVDSVLGQGAARERQAVEVRARHA